MIRKIFNPGSYTNNVHTVLLVLRLTIGIFMLTHGIGKFQNLIGSEPIQFPDPIGVGNALSLILVVFAEVFCSVLLMIGLGTRLAGIPLLITMLVAAFVIHINDGFGKQEIALLYALMYTTIIVVGAGKYSFDRLIYEKISEV